MDAASTENQTQPNIREQILSDHDLDSLLTIAQSYSQEQKKFDLKEQILQDKDLSSLFDLAQGYSKQESRQRPKQKSNVGPQKQQPSFKKRVGAKLALGLTAASLVGLPLANYVGNRIDEAQASMSPDFGRVFTPPAGDTTISVPKVPEATPTPEPKKNPESVGNQNLAEFILGNLPEAFQQRRAERLNNDPDFVKAMFGDAKDETEKQKIMKEIVQSNRINFAFLVIDETRERPNEYSGTGQGRSDVMIVASFDPHTFKSTIISIPRDLYSPTAENFSDSQDAPAKINHLALHTKSSEPVIRREFEFLTNLPIDVAIRINIDGVSGYEENGNYRPGLLNALIPKNGLTIETEEVYDPAFPTSYYGTKEFRMPAGKQVFMPDDNLEPLIMYARSRATKDSAVGRDRRQRQVAIALAQQLLPQIMGDLKDGQSYTLDTLINILAWERNQGNLFSDIDIVELLKVMQNTQQELLKPQNALIFGRLIANTVPKVADLPGNIHNEGLSRGNLLTDASANEGGLNNTYALLKPQGQSIEQIKQTPPEDQLLKYYQDLRQHFRSLFM